jgi:hypothetical protein
MRLFSVSTLLVGLLPATILAADCNRADYFKPGAYNLYMPFRGNSINCQLAENNNSDAVKALQTQLNLCNGGNLKVDGDFGSKTKAALKAAQKANDADDDGIYGPETRSRIKFGLYFNSNPSDKVCKRLSQW